MQQKYCIKQECLRKAQGAFLLAHKMGLLENPSMEGLEARRQRGQLLFGLLGTRAPYRHSSACRIRATGKEART